MLSAIESFVASINGLEYVFAFIGVLIGIVFVSSWRGSLKGADLKNDPRVKNLGWAVVGFFAVLMGRWKEELELEKIDRLRLLIAYSLPLIGIAIAGLAGTALMIFIRSASIRKHSSRNYVSESFGPVLDYLHYGYQYYKQEYEDPLDVKEAGELQRFRELNAIAANQLAGDIVAVDGYRREPSEALKNSLCQQILEHICLIVQAYMKADVHPKLNANVMVAIPAAEAGEAEWKLTQFAYLERNQYSHLLMLRHYAYYKGKEHFALPVEDPVVVPQWKNTVLLGAPEAFLRQQSLVVRTQRLDFAKQVPQNVRQAIRNYFDTKEGFRSFACLPVPGEGILRGIVNVESDQEHIFQESENVQSEIARVLQPFCALLGLIAR
jgi:hypothetical protein